MEMNSRGGALACQLCTDARTKKKNGEKGGFFLAGQCAALSSFRVGQCYFCRKRVCFLQFYKRLLK